MIKTIMALTFLLSANSFAFDSSCEKTRVQNRYAMMNKGFSYAQANQQLEAEFKTCICQSGDETENAIEQIENSVEIELVLENPMRIALMPAKKSRDFNMNGRNEDNGACLVVIDDPKLCNTPLKSALDQYFQVHASCGKNVFLSKKNVQYRIDAGIYGQYDKQ